MTYRSLFKFLFVISFSVVLVACGGGGGGGGGGGNNNSSSSVANQLSPQQITFLFSEVSMIVGDTFGNIASAQGTGLITYSSSNNNIASVDSMGHVTAKQAGTVTITATIAADNRYNTASGSYILNTKALETRNITFEKTGNFTLLVNQNLENAASTTGEGEIFYESSNSDIATVDQFGVVIAHKVGEVTISAKAGRTQQYYEAKNSYTINILSRKDIALTAWIGEKDTLLRIPSTIENHTIYRTASLVCYANLDLLCADAQLDVNRNSAVSDPLTSFINHGYYFLGKDQEYTPIALSTEQISRRYGHQLLSYKNQLFLFGGYDSKTGEDLNDIWISQTGKSWRQLTRDTDYQSLKQRMMVVFNNKIWAIGGFDEDRNDIWSSINGIEWTQESTGAEFSARRAHQLIVFNNKLWLIGGYNDSHEHLQDIWSSEDGVQWSQVTENANLGIESGIHLISFKEKLWLFEEPTVNIENQLWSSSDGENWTKITVSNKEAMDRIGYEPVTFNNRMWIIGGTASDSDHIWSSTDGINWIEENDALIFKDIISHNVVAHNNELVVTGGYHEFYNLNSVFTSKNGIAWTEISPFADFPARANAQIVHFNDLLWLIGGDNKNDVWTSKDGIIWNQQQTANPFRDKFSSASVIHFNSKLWLIGGNSFDEKNDIWSSSDGLSWTKETENAEFPIQADLQIVSHNSKLLIIDNHFEENNLINELWTSATGINWTKQTITSPFPPKHSFETISFNNKVWVIGGFTRDLSSGENTLSTDIWSSNDGTSWTREVANTPFDPRYNHSLIIFNNKLWMIGGQTTQDHSYKNDIWSSTDGINWVNEPTPPFSPRSGATAIAYDNKLFLMGGSIYETPDSLYSSVQNDIWASTDGAEWRLGVYDLFRSNE